MERKGSGERSALTENSRQLSNPYLRWLVVLGTMIVNLPFALPAFYGNLSTYTDSYFLFVVGNGAGKKQTSWILPIYVCFSPVGYLTVDWMVNTFGLFASHIIVLVLMDLGVLLTYFTVQHSVALVMMSLVVCGGYCTGSVFLINLIYSTNMVPHQSGMASAVSSSGFGLGGLLVNFLITSYINPSNLAPDARCANQVYFSQVRILDNVPRSFLLIGANNLVLHVLGLILMHIPLKIIDVQETTSKISKSTNEQDVKTSISHDPLSTERGTHSDYHWESLNAGSVSSLDVTLDNRTDSCTRNERAASLVQDETIDLNPLQVLYTRSFYISWIAIIVISGGYILSLSYYKHFGQLWIKDDVFLTTAGSIASITIIVFRIVVGTLIDRVGLKRTMALILSLNSITMLFWYFTARPSHWLYFVWVQVICAITGSLYILAPMIALKLYGKTHYATNYGLLMTGTIVTGLMEPLLIPAVLENLGWFGLMAVEGTFSLVALTLALFILPEVR